jgi:hypothetical protein
LALALTLSLGAVFAAGFLTLGAAVFFVFAVVFEATAGFLVVASLGLRVAIIYFLLIVVLAIHAW